MPNQHTKTSQRRKERYQQAKDLSNVMEQVHGRIYADNEVCLYCGMKKILFLLFFSLLAAAGWAQTSFTRTYANGQMKITWNDGTISTVGLTDMVPAKSSTGISLTEDSKIINLTNTQINNSGTTPSALFEEIQTERATAYGAGPGAGATSADVQEVTDAVNNNTAESTLGFNDIVNTVTNQSDQVEVLLADNATGADVATVVSALSNDPDSLDVQAITAAVTDGLGVTGAINVSLDANHALLQGSVLAVQDAVEAGSINVEIETDLVSTNLVNQVTASDSVIVVKTTAAIATFSAADISGPIQTAINALSGYRCVGQTQFTVVNGTDAEVVTCLFIQPIVAKE